MANYRYETHTMKNPWLPFIYHPRMRVSQRHSLPNWHENIELLECLEGEGYVRCGTEQFPFTPGTVFVVNPNIPHCIGSESLVRYRCLIVDSTFCTENGLPVGEVYFRNLIRDDRISRLFQQVGEAFEGEQNFCTVAEIRHAVLGLLLTLCRDFLLPEKPATVSAANDHVKEALNYLRRNISQPITLDAVAEYVGVSKYHLSREFKAFTGSTVVQTVNLLRCAEAKGLIEGGMRVSAAAASCGFENLSYFTRTFRKIYGILPSALRQSL